MSRRKEPDYTIEEVLEIPRRKQSTFYDRILEDVLSRKAQTLKVTVRDRHPKTVYQCLFRRIKARKLPLRIVSSRDGVFIVKEETSV